MTEQIKSYSIPPPTIHCAGTCTATMHWFIRLAHEYYKIMHEKDKVQFT